MSGADRLGRGVLGVVAAGWLVVLASILRHGVFVSHDSLSNYVHVWYVQQALWHDHRVPLAMPVIGHGHGLAFPYAFLPWMAAALAWPVLAERAVTAFLVLGFVAAVGATRWAFPELGWSWWAAAALLSPPLVMAPIIGQLPFLWAVAMLLAAVALWRRGHPLGAALAAAAVGGYASRHRAADGHRPGGRGRMARVGARPGGIVPVVGAVGSPRRAGGRGVAPLSPSSRTRRGGRSWSTSQPRWPSARWSWPSRSLSSAPRRRGAPLGSRRRGSAAGVVSRAPRVAGPLVVGLMVAANLAFIRPFDLEYAWKALGRDPNTEVEQFTTTTTFSPRATYRILRAGDGKVGMYQLVRAGARLDSELFPESIDRRSFGDAGRYRKFLRDRHVDFVMVFDSYDRKYRTNEHRLAGVVGVLVARQPDYDVFDVRAVSIETRKVSTTNAASASVMSEWTGRQTWRAHTSSETGSGPWGTSAKTGSWWSGRA